MSNLARAADVARDLVYAERGTGPLLLDLHLPAGSAPPPVVVWVHGGGWFTGDRTLAPDLGRYFVRRGIAMATIEYRLSGEATFPAPLHDLRDAIRFLRLHARDLGIDGRRIGLWGASAGGHLAALAGLTGHLDQLEGEPDAGDASVIAVAASYPPVDLEDREVTPPAPPPGLAASDRPEARLLGGTPEERPEVARAATPLHWVTSAAPPFHLSHGTADRLVPAQHSELLHDALVAVGATSDLYLVDGFRHGFLNPAGRTDVPAGMDDGRLAAEQPVAALRRTSAHDREEVTTFAFDDVGDFFVHHLLEGAS